MTREHVQNDPNAVISHKGTTSGSPVVMEIPLPRRGPIQVTRRQFLWAVGAFLTGCVALDEGEQMIDPGGKIRAPEADPPNGPGSRR